MIVVAAISVLLAFAPPAAPAPPVTPASPSPAPPAPAVPTAPAAEASPASRALETKAFARTVDALRDVKPSTAVAARFDGSVASVAVDLGCKPPHLSLRQAGPRVELVGTSGKDASRTAVLGAMEPSGQAVSWRWNRVGADAFADALREADELLPGMVVTVATVGGGTATAMQPPRVLRATATEAAPARLQVFAPTARHLSLTVDDDARWTRDASEGADIVLQNEAAAVRFRIDDAAGTLAVTVTAPTTDELRMIADRIRDLSREMQRRSPDERIIIQDEIDGLEAQAKDLRAAAQAHRLPIPPLPRLRAVDAAGRTFAILEVTAK